MTIMCEYCLMIYIYFVIVYCIGDFHYESSLLIFEILNVPYLTM